MGRGRKRKRRRREFDQRSSDQRQVNSLSCEEDVCKLPGRSANAAARQRHKPQVDGTKARPPDACLPAEHCWLVKVKGGPPPLQVSKGGGRIPKR